jgi:hypothetical protein
VDLAGYAECLDMVVRERAERRGGRPEPRYGLVRSPRLGPMSES